MTSYANFFQKLIHQKKACFVTFKMSFCSDLYHIWFKSYERKCESKSFAYRISRQNFKGLYLQDQLSKKFIIGYLFMYP